MTRITFCLARRGKGIYQVRALRGTVVDSAGHPVSGATVQLKDVSNSSVRTVTSDRDGLFRFDELSLTQGYNVEAIYKGSSSRRVP